MSSISRARSARLVANHRVHVVPVVLALANPLWQRDVWLDPARKEFGALLDAWAGALASRHE